MHAKDIRIHPAGRTSEKVTCTPGQCRCGNRGKETKVIGYDASEQLEVEPAKYFVRVIEREKRVCTWTFPVRVIPVPRILAPLERSPGTSPRNAIR